MAFKGFGQDISYLSKKENDAVVYPNPVFVGQKFIVKSGKEISKVEVVNVIGKVINRTENNNFNLCEIQVFIGDCEKGMYFVKITFKDYNKKIVRKLLVK
jgi:hypothetical protein